MTMTMTMTTMTMTMTMKTPTAHRKRIAARRSFLVSGSGLAPRCVFLFFCLSGWFLSVVSAYQCPGSKTPPLVLEGKRFYAYDSSTDEYEYVPIRGIAYYPRPNAGPLSQSSSVDFYTETYASRWKADIANLKELGVNAVRLYAVDPSANHDAFMCALSEAGIYVMLGLLADCEGCAIGAWVGVDAEPPTCYPESVRERGKFVIQSFSRYPNLLAFSAGNEVTIYADDGEGGPREANIACQKKFLRDMREYVDGCSGSYPNAVLPRKIPIGVVNWDGMSTSIQQHLYYHCRTDPDDFYEPAEWFALNTYRHCDGSVTSPDDIFGWQQLREDFRAANLPGPVLLGEYGCRERGFPTMDGFETQRTWLQTDALYSPDYSEIFAGGFVFEYSAERKVVDDHLKFFQDKDGLDEPTSEWPYEKFAKIQYGIGYFGPAECEHNDSDSDSDNDNDNDNDNNTCEYTKYPEWDGLARALARSVGQAVPPQGEGAVPPCPNRYPPLSAFDWPTDREADPDLEYCLDLKRRSETDAPTDSPTELSATESPTALSVATPTPTATGTDATSVFLFRTPEPTVAIPLDTEAPTKSNTDSPTQSPTESGTESPTGFITNNDFITSSSTFAPSLVTTSVDIAQCSEHAICASNNLTGFCCPTVDGVFLGCCDAEDTTDDSSASMPPTGLGAALVGILAGIALFIIGL